MSSWLIALFFTIGATGFIYGKFVHSTGNANPKQTVVVMAIAAILIYVFAFTILKYFLNFE